VAAEWKLVRAKVGHGYTGRQHRGESAPQTEEPKAIVPERRWTRQTPIASLMGEDIIHGKLQKEDVWQPKQGNYAIGKLRFFHGHHAK